MAPVKRPQLKIFLLGSPHIECEGRLLLLSRHKALALIAYLATTGLCHRRDTLATLLWPDYDQQQARASLRRVLAAIKKELGEGWLRVQGEEVGLEPDADIWIDVNAFYQRLAACQAHSHSTATPCPACLAMLAEAVALYRGPWMCGFTLRDSPEWDEWQLLEGQKLHDQVASALARLAQGHAANGALEPALAFARQWLALDPLHEPAHACLIELYARSGQSAAALRQYAECERLLRQEIGVSPTPETTALARRIQERDSQLVPSPPAALSIAPPARRKHNLPAQLTPFVGRQAALAELAAQFQDPDCRLITLLGPGGSGKTRLALEVASRHVDHFGDGVFLVSLAPVEHVEALLSAAAYAIGLSLQPGDLQSQVNDWLCHKEILLILDNMEHLAGPPVESARCVDALVKILQAAPQVRMMITSRTRLRVQGEHLFPVTGMEIPAVEAADAIQYEAIQLFLSAARRSQPRFEPTAADLASIICICHLVDGLPLGILLAASWMEVLTPAEIAAELKSRIVGPSLDFLEAGWHDLPDRQRNMRTVFDYSWRLLAVREQAILSALSVFCGSFGRAAAQMVAGASPHELMALVDKSMLQRFSPLPPATGEAQAARTVSLVEGRYEVHQLLRQYAAEKLSMAAAEDRAVHDRHCAYYAAVIGSWAADFKGARQQTALAAMEADLENVLAAWQWALAHRQMDRLAGAMEGLGLFYDWRARYVEAEAVFAAAAQQLQTAETNPTAGQLVAWVRSLGWHSYFARRLGYTDLARDQLRHGLALLDHPVLAGCDTRSERAFILHRSGEIAYWSEDRELARQIFMQSLALYRGLEDTWGTASALGALGMASQGLGLYEEARRLHEESLSIRRAMADRRGVADTLLWLAFTLQDLGEFVVAERLERESLDVSRAIDDRDTAARGLFCLTFTLSLQGRFADAYALGQECVVIRSTWGTRVQMDNVLSVLGLVEMSLGHYEAAQTWLEMGLAENRELDDRWGIGHALLVWGELALARGDAAAARRLLAESASTFEAGHHRAATASALALLAGAAHLLGEPHEARYCMCQALETMAEAQSFAWLLPILPVASMLLCAQGDVERGIEVHAAAWRQPFVAHAQYWQDIAGIHVEAAAAALPPQIIAAARARGLERSLWETVEELESVFCV